MSNNPVIYLPLSLSSSLVIYRAERPSGRGLTKAVATCRKLEKAGVICTVGPKSDETCELVYVPSMGGTLKTGQFYLRGPSHLACALAIPSSVHAFNLQS